jgi:hypothetical protein
MIVKTRGEEFKEKIEALTKDDDLGSSLWELRNLALYLCDEVDRLSKELTNANEVIRQDRGG